MSITKFGKKLFGILAVMILAFVVTACASEADLEARDDARQKVEEVLENITFFKPEETQTNLEFTLRENGLRPNDDLESTSFEHKFGGVVEVTSSNPDIIDVKWTSANIRKETIEYLRDNNGNIIYVQKNLKGETFYFDADGNEVKTDLAAGEPVTYVTDLKTQPVYKLVGALNRPAYGSESVKVSVTFKVSQDYEYLNEENKTVTATYSDSKTVEFTVLPESSPLYEGTIAELKAEALENYSTVMGEGYAVNFNATVTAVHFRSGEFQVADNSGGLYVHKIVPGLQVGDYVNIQGKITQYYSILQVGKDINVTVLGTATEKVQPKPITLAEIKAHPLPPSTGSAFGGEYFVSEGYFDYGQDRSGQANYRLYDLQGNDIQIYYKSHIVWEEKNVLDQYVGKYVRLTYNIYTYYASKTIWQVSFNVSEDTIQVIPEPTLTDEERVANDKAALSDLGGEIRAGEKLVLPTVGLNGSTITWVANPDIIDEEGIVGADLTEDVTLTLTGTITYGTATDTITVEYDVIASIDFLSVAEALEVDPDSNTMIYVKGYVKEIQNTVYGNVVIEDLDGNTILIYGIGPKDAFPTYGIELGDSIGVYGTRTKYGTTQEVANTTFIKKFPEERVITPSDMLAKEVGPNYFTVKGTVANIVNTVYGNFDLVGEDGVTKIYVYGLLTPTGENKKFAEMGIKEGDTLWLIGQRAAYNNSPQIGNARYVKHVTPVELVPVTVAEARAAADNATVKTTGVVTSLIGNNVFIQDETAGVYVYLGPKADFADKLVVGNKVTVTGKRVNFNSQIQIQDITAVDVVATEQPLPQAVVVTDLSTLATYQGQLVTLQNVIIDTIPTIGTNSYSVKVTDGTTVIELRVDKNIANFAEVNAVFSALSVGQTITVQNVGIGQYNTSVQPMISTADQIVVTEMTDADKLAADLAALADSFGNKTDVFELPTTGAFGTQIVWTVKEGTAVVIVDNVVTEVNRPAADGEDAVVVLTATLTLGEEEAVTKDVTVTILKETESSQEFATDLFISEYAEGSSYHKYIEIYNGTGATVDLSIYSVQLYSNGAAAATQNVTLSGTLAHGQVLVLAHAQADSLILALATVKDANLINFNGDDAFTLSKNGTVIDVIGKVGERANWEGTDSTGATAKTTDCVLVRAANITGPSATFDFGQWVAYPKDIWTNLGSHTMGA